MAVSTQTASPAFSRTLVAALLLSGAASVLAQIILLRELLSIFDGNESAVGLMLAVWLLASAAGSGVLGRVLAAFGSPRRIVAALQVVCAFALPTAILLVRFSRTIVPATPGEVLGPGRMLLTSVVALAIYAPLSGVLFAVASRWWMQERPEGTASATSAAYLLETLGAAAGGLLASIALLPRLSSLHIAVLLGTAQVALAVFIALPRRRALFGPLLLLGATVIGWPSVSHWDRVSVAAQWPGLRVVETAASKYGFLAVLEAEGIRSLAQSGTILFTAGDTEAAEEAVHLALLQHPAPRTVLLVGGGVNGSALQVMQHPSVDRLDYVELDPRILQVSEDRFPNEWGAVRADRRIQIHPEDGRAFLRSTERRFDVIILNLPEPRSAQWNRFYTREFFADAAAALNPGGVLGFQLRAAENYLNPHRAAFFQCILQTLRQSFAEVRLVPGDTVYFLASDRPGLLRTDPGLLELRVQERGLRAAYVRSYFLSFRLTAERQADFSRLLEPTPATPVNRDFAPVAYYLDTAAWSTQFGRSYSRLSDALSRWQFPTLLAAVGVAGLFAAAIGWFLSPSRRARAAASVCTATMGMTMLVLELFLLLGFQALYGYVFHQMAVIIAAFMMGMGLGTWRAQRRTFDGPLRPMIASQFAAAAAPVLLWMVMTGIGRLHERHLTAVVAQAGFPFLAMLCGAVGGWQFPLASRLYFGSAGARNTGVLYAWDLAGSCVGALLATLFLIPLFGLGRTAALLSAANAAAALLAVTVLVRDR